MEFDWDASKAKSNLAKHGISFDEAESVFADRRALQRFDMSHSDKEDRFVTIGISDKLRLLFVVHTEQYENTIRIISARRANRAEERYYVEA